MLTENFFVSSLEKGERLDKLLTRHFPQLSRTYFQYLIEEGYVLVNGQKLKKREKLELGDEIEVAFKLTPELNVCPENIPLEILFEDEYLIAINKPAGMVTHPAPGHPKGTFANALLFHCSSVKNVGEALRPGIVHRLDKDTTGVLIAAKTEASHRKLVELFAEKKIEKKYLAICCGIVESAVIDAPIGRDPVHRQKMSSESGRGKQAISHVKTLKTLKDLSLVEVEIITGRTHQIRVHMQLKKTPVLGDALYGFAAFNEKYSVERQLLHAYEIKLPHPVSNEPLHFQAPLPQDMKAFLERNTSPVKN